MLRSLISALSDELMLRQIISDAVSVIVPDMQERIHTLGLAADGSTIGSYSSTPIYVPTQISKMNPVGKRGNSSFKNGKLHRSHYFAGGYRAFKNKSTVNLTLTGELRNQLIAIHTGVGWHDEQQYERALALEKKYGKSIWNLTNQEQEKLQKLILEKLAAALINY